MDNIAKKRIFNEDSAERINQASIDQAKQMIRQQQQQQSQKNKK